MKYVIGFSFFITFALGEYSQAQAVLNCSDSKGTTQVAVYVQNRSDATVEEISQNKMIEQQQGQFTSLAAGLYVMAVVQNSRGTILNVGSDSSAGLSGFYLDTNNVYHSILCRSK